MRRLVLAVLACALIASPALARSRAPWLGGGAAPAVSGAGTIGQVLSVPTYAGATYQWLRNGTAISGATSPAYTLVSADGGTTVSVRVSLAGVSVTSAGVAVGTLNFSTPLNSGLLPFFP